MKILISVTGEHTHRCLDAKNNLIKVINRQFCNPHIETIIAVHDCVEIPDTECKLSVFGDLENYMFKFKCLEHIRYHKLNDELTSDLYDICFFVDSDKITHFDNIKLIDRLRPHDIVTINNHIHDDLRFYSPFISVADYFWYCNSVDFNIVSTFFKNPPPHSKKSLLGDFFRTFDIPEHEQMGYCFYLHLKVSGLKM